MIYWNDLVEKQLRSGMEVPEELLTKLDSAISEYQKALSPYMQINEHF